MAIYFMINRYSGEKQPITKAEYETNRHKKVFTNNFRFEKQGSEPDLSADELIQNHNEELAAKPDVNHTPPMDQELPPLEPTPSNLQNTEIDFKVKKTKK